MAGSAPQASPSPLRKLAAQFEPLSDAEALLLQAAPTSDPADCRGVAGDPSVRAKLVRWLCLDPAAAALLAPTGVQLVAARLDGVLDLAFAKIAFPIALIGCKIPDGLRLLFAELKALRLDQSEIGHVGAQGLSVGGELLMQQVSVKGGVDLRGARVGGNLNLDGATLAARAAGANTIWAENAAIEGNFTIRAATVAGCVQLMNARIGGNFECMGSKLTAPAPEWDNALWLERARISGHAILSGAPDPKRGLAVVGAINLLGTEIDGNLECDGAHIDNGEAYALLAEGLRVKGSVFLRSGFAAIGGVHLLLAQIGGNLDCGYATLRRPKGRVLAADGAKIGGALTLGPGFASEGGVSFTAASIGVSVTCAGSFQAAENDDALGLASATVAGQVTLEHFESHGSVRLVAAAIGGDLNIRAARLVHPQGVALGADAAHVSDSVNVGPAVSADGTVRFHSAKIDLHFTCEGSELTCPTGGDALVLQGIAIKGNLLLGKGFRPVGLVDIQLADIGTMLQLAGADLSGAELILSATHAGALKDEPSQWPAPGKLNLDGFTYDRLLARPFDAEGRLKWLRLQIPAEAARGDSLRLQPYQQIAKVLGAQGYDDATDILMGLQDDRRRYAGLGRLARFGLAALKFTTGYGYDPARALWYIAGFIAASYLIFGAAWQAGEIVPTSQDALTAYENARRPRPTRASAPSPTPPTCSSRSSTWANAASGIRSPATARRWRRRPPRAASCARDRRWLPGDWPRPPGSCVCCVGRTSSRAGCSAACWSPRRAIWFESPSRSTSACEVNERSLERGYGLRARRLGRHLHAPAHPRRGAGAVRPARVRGDLGARTGPRRRPAREQPLQPLRRQGGDLPRPGRGLGPGELGRALARPPLPGAGGRSRGVLRHLRRRPAGAVVRSARAETPGNADGRAQPAAGRARALSRRAVRGRGAPGRRPLPRVPARRPHRRAEPARDRPAVPGRADVHPVRALHPAGRPVAAAAGAGSPGPVPGQLYRAGVAAGSTATMMGASR